MAEKIGADTSYICVKALEKGVNIIGVTRGEVTKIHHTEKLDQGEVLIAQFTENTSAMKIRGKAEVYTQFGMIRAGESILRKNNAAKDFVWEFFCGG